MQIHPTLQKYETTCLIEASIRAFIAFSPENRRCVRRKYHYEQKARESSANFDRYMKVINRAKDIMYARYVSFVDQHNVPLSLPQSCFFEIADSLLDHKFIRRKN